MGLRVSGTVRTVVIGAVNWDVNFFVKRFPHKGEEAIVERVTRVPGGKAGNTVVAAARLLGPAHAAIIGGLGKDSIGAEQVKIFEGEGVVTSGLKFFDLESGQAYIAIDSNGANMIYKLSGANALITPKDLDDPVRSALISEAAVVAIMDPPFETGIRMAEKAKGLGKIVAWDPGVNSELGLENVRPLMKNLDYLVANEHEAANLAGARNPIAAAKKLAASNRGLKAVVKLGGRGCVMLGGGRKEVLPKLDMSALGLKVVNTVGCGDAFLGAFVSALSEGLSDLDALRWGNCAVGLKATRYETRGSPTREMILKYL